MGKGERRDQRPQSVLAYCLNHPLMVYRWHSGNGGRWISAKPVPWKGYYQILKLFRKGNKQNQIKGIIHRWMSKIQKTTKIHLGVSKRQISHYISKILTFSLCSWYNNWQSIVDKQTKKKLHTWKNKKLSLTSKLAFIQSVVMATPSIIFQFCCHQGR